MIMANHISLSIQRNKKNDDSVDIQAYIIADNEDNDGQDLVPIEDDKGMGHG